MMKKKKKRSRFIKLVGQLTVLNVSFPYLKLYPSNKNPVSIPDGAKVEEITYKRNTAVIIR